MARFCLSIILLVLTSLQLSSFAWAHNLNSGYAYGHIAGRAVEMELLLPFPVLLQYDLNKDTVITDEELMNRKNMISAYMAENLELWNNGLKMEYELLSLHSAVQKATEDPVVRFSFRFSSNQEVGELLIRYNVIIHDVDPSHQTYIQLFRNDELIAHQVVAREFNTFQYSPDQRSFHAAELWNYLLHGVQYVVKQPMSWFLLLCILIPERRLKASLEKIIAFTAANFIGFILADRNDVGVPYVWLNLFAWAMLVLLAIGLFIGNRFNWQLPLSVVFGLLHGTGTFYDVMEKGILLEYQTVSLSFYSMGLFLGLTGVGYIMLTTVVPMLAGFMRVQRKEAES
jgi:hypothetical protein